MYNTSRLSAGMHTITVAVAADANYNTASSTGTLTVTSIAPTINFTVPNQTYGAAPFAVSATSNSQGTINYSVINGPATIQDNTVTLTGAGSVQLEALQAANGNYAAVSANASFPVGMASTATSLAGTINIGSNTATLTATVAPASVGSYSTAPVSTVTFYDGNIHIGTVAVVSGTAKFTTGAYAGSQVFTATYNGDTNYSASPTSNAVTLNFTVNPTIAFTTAATYYYGQGVQLTATSNSTGTFTYSLVSGSATVTPAGMVSIIGEGTVTLQVTQAAATGYSAASKQTSFTAVKAGSTTTLSATAVKSGNGSAATLNVTVAPQYSGTPTGSVTFYDGTTQLATVQLTGSTAAYTTPQLAAGSQYTYSATYLGDSNFNLSTSNTAALTSSSIAVSLQLLSTQLIYPLPPAFAVKITPVGSAELTGTVTIYDGASAIATYPVYAQYKGNLLGLVLPPLNVGTHSLSAVYSGDANYAPGQSATVAVTVSPGPVKLTLKCASTKLTLGQTLSCTVYANEGLLPVAGTLTYTVNNSGSGTVTLNQQGQGTITYTPHARGTLTLTANYNVQGNYQAALPVQLAFTVN